MAYPLDDSELLSAIDHLALIREIPDPSYQAQLLAKTQVLNGFSLTIATIGPRSQQQERRATCPSDVTAFDG